MIEVPLEPDGWRADQGIASALAFVAAGPPYPFPRDGMVFANREGLLPAGAYREFTVTTPGVAGRGPRRLVVDDATGAVYLSGDHYQSFSRLIVADRADT